MKFSSRLDVFVALLGAIVMFDNGIFVESTGSNMRGSRNLGDIQRRNKQAKAENDSPDEPMLDFPHESSADEPMIGGPFESSEDEPIGNNSTTVVELPEEGEPRDNSTTVVELPDDEEEGVPRNDVCEAALPVSVSDTVFASTQGAAPLEIDSCGTDPFSGNYSASGLFYTIMGTGEGLTVDFNAKFEIFLTVLSGRDCSDLSCVTGGSNIANNVAFNLPETLQNSSGSVSWASEIGETYYVYPHGIIFGDDSVDDGEFEITFSGGGDIPENYDCSAAIPIEMGQSINGTTTFGQILPEECDRL